LAGTIFKQAVVEWRRTYFSPFGRRPVLPGAFSAPRFAVGILGFSTQHPALFGENAVENV